MELLGAAVSPQAAVMTLHKAAPAAVPTEHREGPLAHSLAATAGYGIFESSPIQE